MGRISATLKTSTEGIAKSYADFYGLSFSEAINTLTASSGIKWWNNLTEAQRKSYGRKFKVTTIRKID